jgi:hypothetical protein
VDTGAAFGNLLGQAPDGISDERSQQCTGNTGLGAIRHWASRSGCHCCAAALGGCGTECGSDAAFGARCRRQHRGLLLPILGFPLLIPVLLPGIAATQLLLAGAAERELFPSFALMTAYAGIVSILGWWLFEWVWQE